MSRRKMLPIAPDGPRFRIVQLWRVGSPHRIQAEIVGSEDTPDAATKRIFSECGHVIAVDRRGDIYADNHKPTQEPV